MKKALEILKNGLKDEPDDIFEGMEYEEAKQYVLEAIKELEELNNRSCENCKNSSFELKFGELEFNSCFLVSNGNVCKWESK